MPSAHHTVSWPASLNEDVITLIELLFRVLDSKSPHAGSQLVEDVFTGNGKFFSSSGYFQGQGAYAVKLHFCPILPQCRNVRH